MANFFAIIMVISFGMMVYYFIKKKTKFALISLAVSFIAFFVVGFTAPSDDHKSSDSSKSQQNKTQPSGDTNKISSNRSNENKNENSESKFTVEDNEKFTSYLNEVMSNGSNNEAFLNPSTMNFEGYGARSVFLWIPASFSSYSKDEKLKFAKEALHMYQENYKIWIKSNNKQVETIPAFVIKYNDSSPGEDVAIWDPGFSDIELR